MTGTSDEELSTTIDETIVGCLNDAGGQSEPYALQDLVWSQLQRSGRTASSQTVFNAMWRMVRAGNLKLTPQQMLRLSK